MNVYVASRFSPDGKRVTRQMFELLRAHGHHVTHDWTVEEKGANEARCAMEDYRGVLQADALVIIPYPFCRGAWVEFGVAVQRCIPIVVVDLDRGPEQWCVFEHLSDVTHVTSLADVIPALSVAQDLEAV